MKTHSKALVGMIVAIAIVLPLMSSALSVEAESSKPDEESNSTPRGWALQLMTNQGPLRLGGAILRRFLSGAEAVTIEGEVIAYFRHILIVDSGGKRLNVVLPRVWNVNNEVINVSQIFEDYINAGDTVSMEALQSTVTNKNGVTFTAILAYEITSGEHTFYAVLPFNIDAED